MGFHIYPQTALLKIRKLFYRHTIGISQMTDFVGNTSEHEHFQFARSMASHDNHINAIFPGELYDLLRRVALNYG